MSSLYASERKRAAVLVTLVVAIEAIVVLGVLRLGTEMPASYDGQAFDHLALNLLYHHAFSPQAAPPYYGTYFRAPGYPAFIAAIYAVFGHSALAVRIAQFVALALTGFFTYLLARRFFSDRTAGIGALLCVTYSPLVFLSAMYIGEILSTLGLVLAFIQIVDIQRDPSHPIRKGLLVGVTFALTALVRPSFGLVFCFIGLAMLWTGRRVFRATFIAVFMMGVGYTLVMGPWVLRNRTLVGRFVGPQASGWGLYVSAQQYAGEISYGLLRPEWRTVMAEFDRRNQEAERAVPATKELEAQGRSVVALRELEVERNYTRDATERMHHIPLSRMLRSYPFRLYWLWSTADLSPYGTGLYHRFLQVWHMVLVALTIFGIVLDRRNLMAHSVLWITALYVTILHSVYHVEARYTVPARPLLWIYAAVALAFIADRMLHRDRAAGVERYERVSISI